MTRGNPGISLVAGIPNGNPCCPLERGNVRARFALLALTLVGFSSAAETSLFYLPIRNNDLATLRHLIRDPGPKARDARGNSPLMYAAALGSLESMRLLLDAGAGPNAANDFAATSSCGGAGDAPRSACSLQRRRRQARSDLGRTPRSRRHDGARGRPPPD